MKRRYTVVGDRSALKRLADLWLDNPAIRQEITDAANEVETTLAHEPKRLGIPTPGRARLVVRPPLAVLYVPYEEDRQVHVILVKFWDD